MGTYELGDPLGKDVTGFCVGGMKSKNDHATGCSGLANVHSTSCEPASVPAELDAWPTRQGLSKKGKRPTLPASQVMPNRLGACVRSTAAVSGRAIAMAPAAPVEAPTAPVVPPVAPAAPLTLPAAPVAAPPVAPAAPDVAPAPPSSGGCSNICRPQPVAATSAAPTSHVPFIGGRTISPRRV